MPVVLTLLLLFVLALPACSRTALLAVNSLALSGDYYQESNVVYGKHDSNKLDIYIPEFDQSTSLVRQYPVIIFFYGGCWGGCKTYTKEYYRFVAQTLTSEGNIVVIPDYRLYPQADFTQIMDDARHATDWVHGHIHEYGGNTNRLFLMGHSAGAHLAAMLTLDEVYLKPATYASIQGFIGLAGPYDFLPFTEAYQRAVFDPPERYAESQPVNYVDGTEPPLLLLYGKDDESVRPHNIDSLEQKVMQKGGQVRAYRYSGIDHTGILGALSLPQREHKPVLRDITAFIDSVTSSE